ncbi:carbohydrate ABC transporter permease [Paenibacillus sp. J2TS4]|uniref:carbohydrate ABC transporter permease n=1 Tax=Paenibacillus sp. J2TS4 TaxID=2807194 RepID=UPI001BD09843|nr:sugar ABC transporter permease [Paenibacillus sp. J2TS4]
MNTALTDNTPPLHPRSGRKKGKKRISHSIKPYLFLLPCLFFVVLFTYYPFAKTLHLGFTLVDMNGDPVEFVGLENYIEVFKDKQFARTLLNTLKYTVVTIPGIFVISLTLALLAEKRRKGSTIYQVMFALPMAVSMSSTVMIFQLLMNPTIGMFNYITGLGINWFGDENYAMLGIAILSIWMGLGINFLFLLASLRNVPQELLESASIEGANYIQQFTKIKFPLITPTVFFLICTDLIGALMVFGPVMILTKGGPMGSTETMIYWMYTEAFEKGKYGYGSAIAVIIFFLVMLFTLLTFIYERRGVHYS